MNNKTVSWLFAAGLALALSASSFSGALGWQQRAVAECAATEASPWCGMGSSVVHTVLLFAGIGFLLLAALFALAANNARVAARGARNA